MSPGLYDPKFPLLLLYHRAFLILEEKSITHSSMKFGSGQLREKFKPGKLAWE